MTRSAPRFLATFLVAGALLLSGCGRDDGRPEVEPPKPGPIEQAEAPPAPANGQASATPQRPELPPLFRDIERRTFQFFWDVTNEENGMTPDRFPSRPFASIASIGFALTAYPIGVENGWIGRRQAVDRTLLTLKFLRDAPQGDGAEGFAGNNGYFYHFLDMQDGHRFKPWVELSSVDTGLLMMGVLFAQSYYTGDDDREREIREVAEDLYTRVEWPVMQQRGNLLSMGWFPERGYINHDWKGYNEAMLLMVLALGSPTHPVAPESWDEWLASYDKDWGVYQGQEYLSFGPHFGHQYSHVWIDFRGIRDRYMRTRGIDYFENSRRATYAQRQYAIENPMRWQGYSADVWGLTASDGPQVTNEEYEGEVREFRHYSARGAGISDFFDDGTIAPTAAIASLPFAPEIVVPATVAIHEKYGDYLFSSYGFLDSFNPSFNYDIPLKTGRLVPGRGWVASDYIGIDQGPILTMIANYRNEFVWNTMKKNPHVRRGLERAGFTGGWLEALQKQEQAAAAEAEAQKQAEASAPAAGEGGGAAQAAPANTPADAAPARDAAPPAR